MREKIYIGGYENEINICEFYEGNLKIMNKIKKIENPSYLHINDNVMYAVGETEIGEIYSLKVQNNNLKRINSKTINESLPCYITTNTDRTKLLVSNYGGGSINVFALNLDGSIGDEISSVKNNNSNMHFAEFIGQDIIAIDLGQDKLYVYDLNLKLKQTLDFEKGTGPRHLAISNDEKIFFVITELSNEIYVFEKNFFGYNLIQKVDTVETKNIESYAGAIKITKDNKNLYVTNRGENTIAVFLIKNGKLEFVERISSYGEFPRDILLNEDETYLLVANQKSNNIEIFKRDIQNGKLLRVENAEVNIEKPSCIIRSN